MDNPVEELRCSFIRCVANVSRLLKLRARGDIPVFVALSQVPTFALFPNNNNNNTKHFLALTPAGAESDLNASTNGA